MDLALRLNKIEQTVHHLRGQRDKLKGDLDTTLQRLMFAEHEGEVLDGIKTLLEALSKTGQESIKKFIEPLVTEAYEYVYSKGMKFRLDFVERRNQMEIDFLISGRDDICPSGSLEDTKGGGVLDVTCLILRLGLLHVFQVEGPMIVDEPTKFTDEIYNARVGSLLRELSQRFKRQIILTTHSMQLATYGDKIYNVAMDPDEISHVRLET